MTTLAKVKAEARKIGATVTQENCGNETRLGVEAPKGYCWDEGLHEFVDWTYKPWKPDYDDMLARMKHGCEPCTDVECDWCHPIED